MRVLFAQAALDGSATGDDEANTPVDERAKEIFQVVDAELFHHFNMIQAP